MLRFAKLLVMFLMGTTSFLILIFLLLFVAAVTLENKSATDLHNVKVSFADKEVWKADNLKAGRSQWMWSLTNGAPIVIEYDVGDRRVAYRCGYLSGVADGHQSFVVDASGSMPDCRTEDFPWRSAK